MLISKIIIIIILLLLFIIIIYYYGLSSIDVKGKCGASYAFSAMAALEGASALATGYLVDLSEQNIIDCSGMAKMLLATGAHFFLLFLVPYGNHGCKGGCMSFAYKYVIANEGVNTANSYPFYGKVS